MSKKSTSKKKCDATEKWVRLFYETHHCEIYEENDRLTGGSNSPDFVLFGQAFDIVLGRCAVPFFCDYGYACAYAKSYARRMYLIYVKV